jgi:predicted TIM-barrel fold metal-dependent hydrolase
VAVHLGFAGHVFEPDEDGRWASRMAIMQFQRTACDMNELIANLVFHGVFERFPGLTFLSVETGCGWLPFYIEQLDDQFQRHRFWTNLNLKLRPSEYVKRQVLSTFQIDLAAIKAREGLVQNFMWSSDYPHTGTDWPNSQKLIEFHMQGVPEDEKWLMAGGNYARVFKLQGPADAVTGNAVRESSLVR